MLILFCVFWLNWFDESNLSFSRFIIKQKFRSKRFIFFKNLFILWILICYLQLFLQLFQTFWSFLNQSFNSLFHIVGVDIIWNAFLKLLKLVDIIKIKLCFIKANIAISRNICDLLFILQKGFFNFGQALIFIVFLIFCFTKIFISRLFLDHILFIAVILKRPTFWIKLIWKLAPNFFS